MFQCPLHKSKEELFSDKVAANRQLKVKQIEKNIEWEQDDYCNDLKVRLIIGLCR